MRRSPARANNPKPAVLEGRIGSGLWGGRKIILAKHDGLRPTKDRVRQAVFNLLQTRVALDGAVVFDLCCGSGAYGLEALSRAAGKLVCVDTHVGLVRENASLLKADAEVVTADVLRWVPGGELADVVFVDPPYKSGMVQSLWARRAELAKPGSWWVCEVGSDEILDMVGMEDAVVRDYGATRVVVGRMAG